jgi:hypothetical protein
METLAATVKNANVLGEIEIQLKRVKREREML